jgi:hypothetical protein
MNMYENYRFGLDVGAQPWKQIDNKKRVEF